MPSVVVTEAVRIIATHVATAVARVEVFDSFRAVEREWRALEQGQTATPYQRFDLVNAWQDHVGNRLGAKALPVVAYDAEQRTVMVLPLVVRRIGPFRIACF